MPFLVLQKKEELVNTQLSRNFISSKKFNASVVCFVCERSSLCGLSSKESNVEKVAQVSISTTLYAQLLRS